MSNIVQEVRKHLDAHPEIRAKAIARAPHIKGRVCCDFCKKPIKFQQNITLQHVVPVRSVKEWDPKEVFGALDLDFYAWEKFAPLDDTARREFLIPYLNHPDNLKPMHSSCHSRIDDEATFTKKESYLHNLRPKIREKKLEGKKIKTIVAHKVGDTPFVALFHTLPEDYHPILSKFVLDADERESLRSLPGNIITDYRIITRRRLNEYIIDDRAFPETRARALLIKEGLKKQVSYLDALLEERAGQGLAEKGDWKRE